MQVAPSGTACKRIYESTYALPVGRKRRAASAMKRWTLAGCVSASSVSHLLYLNTVGVAGQFFRRRVMPSARFPYRPPGMLVVQSSADTLRDSIKNDREDNNNEIALFSEISLTPPGGESIGRVDTATMLSASSIISNLLPRLALGRNFD